MLLSSKRQNTTHDEFHVRDAERDAFNLLQTPKFQEWLSASGPCFLAINNVIDATGTSAVLQREFITQASFSSNHETRLVQFFEFKNTDCRYNTVSAMLSTFLAEVYHRNIKTRDTFSHLPQTMDIESQFNMFQNIISAPECPDTIWTLVNFNKHLPRSQWLLRKLESLAATTEIRFKVLFINSSGQAGPSGNLVILNYETDIPSEQPDYFGDVGSEQLDSPFSSTVTDLTMKHPAIVPKLETFLKSSEADPELRQMLGAWLSCSDTMTILSVLEQVLPGDALFPTTIFDMLWKAAASHVDARGLMKILNFIIFALRPLTTHELFDLITTSATWDKPIISNLLKNTLISFWLPGILIVQRNEVSLGHRHLRDFLLSENHGATFWSNRRKAHVEIAVSCLRYISSPRSRLKLEQYSIHEPEQVAGPESRLDFLQYAIKYWPFHVKQAGAEFKLDSVVLQTLLHDSSLLMLWTRAYTVLSKTFIKLDLQIPDPLAIFAEHGLESILNQAIIMYTNTPSYSTESSTAPIVAAACGETNIVRLLLERLRPNSIVVERAISAAFSLEDGEDILELLLDYFMENAQGFDDISSTFDNAVLSGRPGVVQHLCTRWKIPDNRGTYEGALLHAASVEGSIESIRHLCEQDKGKLCTNDFTECVFLSSQHGHLETAVFLTEQLWSRCRDGGQRNTGHFGDQTLSRESIQHLLEEAIIHGGYVVLDSLLTVLHTHHARPHSVEGLFNCAIQNGRTECFQRLLNHYNQSIDATVIRRTVMKEGTSAMLRKTLELGALDDSSFPETIDLVQERSMSDLGMIETLIEQGQRHISKDVYIDQMTNLLRFAVTINVPSVVRALIAAEADMEQKTLAEKTQTPLFYAAYMGYEEVVASLLEAKANVHARTADKNAWEPIHAAADYENILRLMINAGADVNARTAGNHTPLMLAVVWGNDACVEELLKHQPDLHCTPNDESLLCIAAASGNSRLAFWLLDAGMDPCGRDVMKANRFILHRCVEYNDVALLQRLLLYNLPIEHKDKLGRSPLNCLESWTEIEIPRLLLNRGALVNTLDDNKKTPLFKMVKANNVQKAELLMSKGARPEMQNRFGHTALDIAFHRGSLELICMMVNKGADLDSFHHETFFQLACRRTYQRSAVLAYLLKVDKHIAYQRSVRWGSNLSTACLAGDIEIVKALVALGVNVNNQDRVGRAPIQFALYCALELVHYLQEQGADLSQKDVLKRNALHFAVASGRLEIVRYVLKQKPNLVNEPDCDGCTPLFWAVRKCWGWGTVTGQRGAIIDELKARGARLTLRVQGAERWWSPYELARYYDLDEEVVQLVKPDKESLEDLSTEDKRLWQYIIGKAPEHFRKGKPEEGSFCNMCLMVSAILR